MKRVWSKTLLAALGCTWCLLGLTAESPAAAAANGHDSAGPGHEGWSVFSSALPAEPAQTEVDTSPVGSEKDLVQRSDLVVLGVIGEKAEAYPTGKREGTYRVQHYVQTIKIKEVWKGRPVSEGSVTLLTSGLEPLPPADNPLNEIYTGPLETGEYVCFLRRTAPNSPYCTLTGLWQGLYPVYAGKSVALLANNGFSTFDQLPLSTFRQKVKALD